MTPTSATMEELVQRVNCYGVGPWLGQVLADLEVAFPTAPVTLPRSGGLVLKIDALAPAPQSSDRRDAFYISLAEADDTVPPPLGLDATSETIDSARAKLSPSIAGGSPAEIVAGDRRVSFFMDGGRVIELRYKPNLVGFDRIVVARLGAPQDWRDPSSH